MARQELKRYDKRQIDSFFENEKVQERLMKMVGRNIESFNSNVASLIGSDTAIQQCAPNTIMYALLKATALGLPIGNNFGFAYILPYNNTTAGEVQAQFQMGYKGLIQLAQRSGQFKIINTSNVREGEYMGQDRLSGEAFFKWMEDSERLKHPIVGYVAYMKLNNGFSKSLYMSIDDIKAHGKKYSKSFNSPYSPWSSNFDAMAEKTVLKLLLSKYAPISIATKPLYEAIKVDQAVIIDEDSLDYVDNDNIDEEKIAKAESMLSQ